MVAKSSMRHRSMDEDFFFDCNTMGSSDHYLIQTDGLTYSQEYIPPRKINNSLYGLKIEKSQDEPKNNFPDGKSSTDILKTDRE